MFCILFNFCKCRFCLYICIYFNKFVYILIYYYVIFIKVLYVLFVCYEIDESMMRVVIMCFMRNNILCKI